MRILLVEDNPGDAVLAQEAFRATGSDQFELEHVGSLQAAIDRLASGGIDLVILDLGLPDSTGMETFYSIRQHDAIVPLVIASGLDDESVAASAVLAGAQDYLVKGKFTPLSLVMSIQRAIGRHSHSLLKEVLDKMQSALQDTSREMHNITRFTKGIVDDTKN